MRVVRSAMRGAALILLGATAAGAQQLPSPAQAQQMLKTDPSLAARVQQLVQNSGLTPDQIRERLRAQGYPDSLLDQYLGTGQADSSNVPSDDVFAAVRALGLGDSTAVDSLSAIARVRRRVSARADSAFLDSVRVAMSNDSTARAIRAVLRSRELQRQEIDSGFTVFGMSMFSTESGLFNPNTTAGVDPAYRFGPGDKLVLILTGDVEKSYPLTVTKEGFVVIPAVGTVNVAGLTRAELDDQLFAALRRVYASMGRGADAHTRFYVDVSQVGTNQVFVNGDVQHPNSYQVSRAGTMMTALYMAGGPTPDGSMRRIELRRGGRLVGTFDVYDYALHGDASRDLRLESGDIVFVPPRGPQVRIAGAVLRPATYELQPNETVADVIRMAGGFSEVADTRRLQIERIVPVAQRTTAGTDRRMVDVPEDLFASAPVRGGDVIRVREVARRVANRIAVHGSVWAPGTIGFSSGMHLYDALRRAGGLKPDSYLGQVLISRLRPDSTREMLRTALYDTTGRPVDNLTLQDGDDISVFSLTDFRPHRYITIGGAVRKPGQIPYREGMTLHDAVLLADGLAEGALLDNAEIARLPENRAAGVTAITTTVPLDSSYLVGIDSDGSDGGSGGLPAPSRAAPQVVLHPYDAILIKWQPGWRLQQTVWVEGEVQYPGVYALTHTTEKLSDVLRRAGGLTPRAYAGGVVFVRRHGNVGRIGVDLPRVLRDSGFIDNLPLVDGDSIFIPAYAPIVTVRGAVNSPVALAYVEGADLDYYIRSAGGVTTKGDAPRAYVTQPNGKVDARHRHFLGFTTQPEPQPGSTVVVPERDPNDKFDWLQIATAATSILGSLVAISAIIRR